MENLPSYFLPAFKHSPVGAVISRMRDGVFVEVNDAFCCSIGYIQEELIGRTAAEIKLWVDEIDHQHLRDLFEHNRGLENAKIRFRHRSGDVRIGFVSIYLLPGEGEQYLLSYVHDLTEREQADDRLRFSEERSRSIMEVSTDFAFSFAILPNGQLKREWITEAYDRLSGYTSEERDQFGGWPFPVHEDDVPLVKQAVKDLLVNHQTLDADYRLVAKNGQIHWVRILAKLVLDEQGRPIRMLGGGEDITARKLAEQQHNTILRTAFDGYWLVDLQGHCLEVNDAYSQLTGYSHDELLHMSITDVDVFHIDDNLEEAAQFLKGRGVERSETRHRCKDGRIIDLEASAKYLEIEDGRVVIFFRDISERKRAEQDLKRRMGELEAVNRLTAQVRSAETIEKLLPVFLDETLSAIDAEAGVIAVIDPSSGQVKESATRGWIDDLRFFPIRSKNGMIGAVLTERRTVISDEFVSDPRLDDTIREKIPAGWGGVVLPIQTASEAVGILLISVQQPRQLTPGEIRLLETISEILGNAIQRMRLLERTRRGMQRLAALHEIDRAIVSSMDLRVTLYVILTHVQKELDVDACAVLLVNPGTNHLEYVTWRGFRTRRLEIIQIHSGEGIAGRALYSNDIVCSTDLAHEGEPSARARLLRDEGFTSACAISFKSKGQAVGVLEVYQRSELLPDQEWYDFMEGLAGQIAITVENVRILENLYHTNMELIMAYDATIEALSRAMDLRDRDTEGHSLRVSELTQGLALRMGISENELVNIRRGALLHDLGKIGIPDNILNKDGPLIADEWKIMRQHPRFAYELLSSIDFLHQALDIPYSHHEKWDGSGYPNGLMHEQIPLAARLFAVVDVWDALSSDRPYRKAWPEEKILEYIREQAGKHFDPQVVEAFLSFLADQRKTHQVLID